MPAIAQLPRESAPEDIERLVSALSGMVGVAEVSVLSERELRDLVEPWLPEEVLSELTFFPIFVEITDGGRDNLDRRKLLSAVGQVPGGILMNLPVGQQGGALGSFIVHCIAYFTLLLLLALFFSTVIFLVARLSIGLNRDVVNVLRLLGATELFLVQEFRLKLLRVAIIGSSIGSIMAVGTALFILLVVIDLGVNELLPPNFNFFLLFAGLIWVFVGPFLTWMVAPTIIGRELSLLKKPRW
tara:strand:- start:599 stop:1324 length:726 start_codon:yes stop_codon:yes gene_type:complete